MSYEEFKNNPLYTDITKLDHLSPSPTFPYNWNSESGRWEPAGGLTLDVSGDLNIDLSNTDQILSQILDTSSDNKDLLIGISGELSQISIDVELDQDTETHRLLSGISGQLNDISLDVEFDQDTETHRLLSGISGELSEISLDVKIDEDTETHRLLSGISGELADLSVSVDVDSKDLMTHDLLSNISGQLTEIDNQVSRRDLSQQWKLRTKTVNQKIEEDFILMEDIPEDERYGTISGECYGIDRDIMDDIFGTHFNNGRTNISTPEVKHPDYFIHSEYINPDRCVQSKYAFHTDTEFSLRQENTSASLINSYEINDFNELYERGLVDHITLYNESPYPIHFHTADRREDKNDPVSPKNKDLLILDSDMAVKIENDECGRIFVKRPHTISGYTIKYAITYKKTGEYDTIE